MLCGAIVAALSFSMISCDNDNNGGNGGSSANTVGGLHSGTALDNDLPDGYRVSSVGDYDYNYDEVGRLTGFSDDDMYYEFQKGTYNIKFEDDGESVNASIKVNGKGCVTSANASSYYSEGDGDYEKGTISFSLSYNGNNLLTSASVKESWEEYEDGERERGSYTENHQLTYSGTKLTKVVTTWEEKEGHTDSGTYTLTYSYDADYENPFYQYTPRLLMFADEMEPIDALAYVGMLGRASSMFPSSVKVYETDYCSEEKETDEWEHTYDCGPYRFNSYSALSSADGKSYRYTSIGSRGLIDYAPMTDSMLKAEIAKKFRHKKHAHSKHVEHAKK